MGHRGGTGLPEKASNECEPENQSDMRPGDRVSIAKQRTLCKVLAQAGGTRAESACMWLEREEGGYQWMRTEKSARTR